MTAFPPVQHKHKRLRKLEGEKMYWRSEQAASRIFQPV